MQVTSAQKLFASRKLTWRRSRKQPDLNDFFQRNCEQILTLSQNSRQSAKTVIDEESQDDLRSNKNMNVYKGALYENVIAEALCKQGYELFYYKKKSSTLEQDFFVRTKKSLVPVEVKSTNGKAKSLSTLIKSDSYPDITTGIKLIHGNVGFENNIHTFPYFCAFLLKRYLKDVEF